MWRDLPRQERWCLEKDKLPAKRLISFSEQTKDVNKYIADLYKSNPKFNFSAYVCGLIREKMNGTVHEQQDLELLIKKAMREVLAETNFNISIAQVEEVEEEFLMDCINALDGL